jgi:uncharacterized protein RhaS with RHS repeats
MKKIRSIALAVLATLTLVPQSHAVLYWGRAYDPNLQRWLTRDPIGEQGGINLYQFVLNDPLNFIDPFGLSQRDINVIINMSQQFIQDLNQQGKRLNDGHLNNMISSAQMAQSALNDALGNKDKANDIDKKRKMGCGEQAAALGAFLRDKDYRLVYDWKFFLVESTGAAAGSLPEPHQFLMAQSNDPSDPILYLDPWAGTFGKKPPPMWRIGHITPLQ